MLLPLALLAALLTVAGIALTLIGARLVCRFRAAPGLPPAADLPPISLLKPLYRDEALLEAALASACAQDYPRFQVVFGVQDAADPALGAVWRLCARYPGCDIAVVVDDSAPGANRKVANLTNMLAAAKHEILVIADSDVHAAPDYLRRIATALAQPGTGLVTTLYAGLPANATLAARMGARAITHGFLPGALLARAMGRRDALGATMALRRATLAAIGGFAVLRDHLADDNMLGRMVAALGLDIALAATVPATTVPETRVGDLFRHELRWGRTIRAIAPVSFAVSAVQYPLGWALLAVVLAGGAPWALLLFALAWTARALAARAIDRMLGLGPVIAGAARAAALWQLPLRDLMSIGVVLASYLGDRVEWRGQSMRTAAAGRGVLAREALGIERA